MSNQPKERPILFSAPMVRALLDGSKTQTRRVVKPRKDASVGCTLAPCELAGEVNNGEYSNCPYGRPGDRLWVRESYRFTDVFDGDCPTRVGERCLDAGYSKPWAPMQYDADGVRRDWRHTGTPPHDGAPQPGKGRPSIHMPRWASRILLEIVAVRIERLQAISDADAIAEGVDRTNTSIGGYAKERYRRLWDQINGAGSWDVNPLVWVIEFKRAPTGQQQQD